jgi:hypothetical protein
VLALQALPASRHLPSCNRGKNLFGDLSRLNLAINAGDFDVERVIPLLTAVFNNESDDVIWDKVYDVVAGSIPTAVAKPSTPPPTDLRPSSFQQTPWTFNTGSFADTSDLRKNLDPLLKGEVEDNLRVDHPDVFNTYFGGIPGLLDIATAVFKNCKDAEPPLFQDDVGWIDWPDSCEEIAVSRFLHRHINQLLLFADEHGFRPSKRRRCITTPNKPIPGSVSKRKLDVGLAYNSGDELEESSQQSYDWSHILVPGELKSNPREDNHSSTWLDLVRYVREIFSAQDTRRFVLGFTICGSMMRLWEFDRLGAVGSTPFDINKDGKMFVSVMLGYLWMSEEELGFDPTVVEDDGRYTCIWRGGQTERVYLEELINRRRSVAGRATTCWRGSLEDEDGRVVIKDSWEYEERPEEGLLLKEATEAGVENVARYYHHETVRTGSEVDDVLSNVRKGLSDTIGRNPFQQRRAAYSEAVTSPTTSGTLGPGRGRSGSRSRSRTSTRKRSSSSQTSMPPPKRSCSDSPVKQNATQPRNRVHRRLVMLDVGKSIYDGSSPRAVLTGLLGGIKGEHHKMYFRPRAHFIRARVAPRCKNPSPRYIHWECYAEHGGG